MTLDVDIQFTLLGQELHLAPRAAPRARRVRRAQPRVLFKRPFGVPTKYCAPRERINSKLPRSGSAVHHPDAPCLHTDARCGQELRQCGRIGRVAGQHLIGERQAFRRHDQGDHHLHAVKAVIARVAEAALVILLVTADRTRNTCSSGHTAAHRSSRRINPASDPSGRAATHPLVRNSRSKQRYSVSSASSGPSPSKSPMALRRTTRGAIASRSPDRHR